MRSNILLLDGSFGWQPEAGIIPLDHQAGDMEMARVGDYIVHKTPRGLLLNVLGVGYRWGGTLVVHAHLLVEHAHSVHPGCDIGSKEYTVSPSYCIPPASFAPMFGGIPR